MPELELPTLPDALQLSIFGIQGRLGNAAVVSCCPAEASDLELKSRAASYGGATCALLFSNAPFSRVRFFTPSAELPFCVHGAIAAGASIAHCRNAESARISVRGREYVIRREADSATITLRGPFEERRETDAGPVLEALGLESRDVDSRSPVLVASAGSPKWLVHVNDWEALQRCKPRLADLARLSRLRGVNGAYVFATEGHLCGSDVTARAFNPAAGVDEDAATGVAAAALAWVSRHEWRSKWSVISQFRGSSQTGLIRVRVNDDDSVQVGGEVRITKGTTQ